VQDVSNLTLGREYDDLVDYRHIEFVELPVAMTEKILIAAIDADGGIGKDDYMPWYYPEDLKSFMQLTMGHTIVMGRKTFAGMHERGKSPLKGRKNIIVTRNAQTYQSQFAEQYSRDILDFTTDIDGGDLDLDGKVFYCGGAEIYRQAIESMSIDIIYLSRFAEAYHCDTFFPKSPSSSDAKFTPHIPPYLTLTSTTQISGTKPFMLETYIRGEGIVNRG
jgi:dihydrofolate reductase